MFGRKERFIRSSDIDNAMIKFLHDGTTPNKIYGEVIGNGLRDFEFVPSSKEAIAAHNLALSEQITQRVMSRHESIWEAVKRRFPPSGLIFETAHRK